MISSEVIVVGGGPAGSTCARHLQRAGVDTIVLDKQDFPRDKLCAGWITPKVIKDLKINLDNYPGSAIEFSKLNFHFYGKKLSIKTHQYSIRRFEFDNWLLQRAEVKVYKHKVDKIKEASRRYIIDDKFSCKYLVGAGGTNCPVSRQFFISENARDKMLAITAMEQELKCDYQDKNCYLWFFEDKLPGYSWYVPKGGGFLNIGIGGVKYKLKEQTTTIRQHWGKFVNHLNELDLIKDIELKPKGYNYYLKEKKNKVRTGNILVIGDAAGVATKDMGEGIGPSIESGILAARSIINNTDYSLRGITSYSFKGILFGIV